LLSQHYNYLSRSEINATNGARRQLFPANYVTCFAFAKVASKAMLIIFGLGMSLYSNAMKYENNFFHNYYDSKLWLEHITFTWIHHLNHFYYTRNRINKVNSFEIFLHIWDKTYIFSYVYYKKVCDYLLIGELSFGFGHISFSTNTLFKVCDYQTDQTGLPSTLGTNLTILA
jgi:hypothetical protein